METVALEIVFAPDSVTHELALEWADEMTDDTFAEWYAGRGEVRDVDHNRNMEMLRERLGVVSA